MPGIANHDSIKQVVRAGFSPLETIRMATLGGATFHDIQDRTGSIAVGKEADLQASGVFRIKTFVTLTTSRSASRDDRDDT